MMMMILLRPFCEYGYGYGYGYIHGPSPVPQYGELGGEAVRLIIKDGGVCFESFARTKHENLAHTTNYHYRVPVTQQCLP